MAPKKKLDTSQLDKAVAAATLALVNRLSAEYTKEISSPKWDWIDGRQRDIVDTGRLRASQTFSKQTDTKYQFVWPVEYAGEVHEGTNLKSGVEWPARPWTRTALENFDAKKYFEDILRRELNG